MTATELNGASREEPEPNPKKIILIADDDEVLRGLLEPILEKEDRVIILAVDGEETWNIYQQMLQEKKPPDLLFLDYNMPKMTGLEVAERVRYGHEDIKPNPDIPIFITTATDPSLIEPEIMTRMRTCANEILPKPFPSNREIQTLVQNALQSSTPNLVIKP